MYTIQNAKQKRINALHYIITNTLKKHPQCTYEQAKQFALKKLEKDQNNDT